MTTKASNGYQANSSLLDFPHRSISSKQQTSQECWSNKTSTLNLKQV